MRAGSNRMTDSNGVKRRGPGRPFKKGDDPNRHPFGRASQKRAMWMTAVLNQLPLELKPKEAARLIAKWYRQGKVPIIVETHDRLGGKVTQPINAEHNVVFRVIYDKSAKDNNANG